MSGRRIPRARLALSAVTLSAVALSAVALSAVALAACSTASSTATSSSTAASSSTTVTTVPGATTVPVITTPRAATSAPASAFAATVTPVAATDLVASWRDGCPLAPDQLRLVRLGYWGFDDQPHAGALVVNAAVTDAAISVFGRLYDEHFPIRRMDPIDAFGGDDNASMAADNTSGFNCRAAVAPGPPQWSAHAYGQAIDVNPVENPYIEGGEVLPPVGAPYVDRSSVRPGMAVPGGQLTDAFAAAGWSWGGTWSSPDYQHFSSTGG